MTMIRFGGYQPERSVLTRAARQFGTELTTAAGEAVHFEFVPNIQATGRPVSDLLTLTEAGDLSLCYFASSYLAQRVPELGVLDLPFPGADRARVWAKLDGPVGERLRVAVAQRTGYQVLGFWDNGIRHISNGVRPIRHPRDCVGLSIRTLDNRFHQRMFAALGLVPRFIDVSELPAAVAEKRIDAQENPLTNLVNFDIHKTHRHVAMTGHLFGVALLLANRAAVESWTADVRGAVETAAATATAEQHSLAAAEDDQCRALLEADGVEIVPPEELDLAAFRAAVADVVAAETAGLDPDLLAAWRAE